EVALSSDGRSVAYRDFPRVAVADGLTLPVADILVRLEPGESADSVRVESSSSLLMAMDPNLLTRTTTSASERYADLGRRLADLNLPGRQVVEHLGEVWIAAARYARLLVFPVTIAADGALVFHEQFEFALKGGALSDSRVVAAADLLRTGHAPSPRSSAAIAASSDPDYAIVTAA